MKLWRQSSVVRRFKVLALVLAVLTWLFSAVNAQETRSRVDGTRDRRSAVTSPLAQKILDLVPSVPPELAAYAQLTLAESNITSSHSQRIELIESAFDLARSSPYPIRKSFAFGDVDSRAGYLSASYDLKLDALSLQTSAVTAMLKIDPQRDDFCIEKSRLYVGFLQAAASLSPVYEDAVTDFSTFLATPPRSDAVGIFWLSNLHILRALTKSNDAKKVLDAALERAPNPAIAMWGYLDGLVETPGR